MQRDIACHKESIHRTHQCELSCGEIVLDPITSVKVRSSGIVVCRNNVRQYRNQTKFLQRFVP